MHFSKVSLFFLKIPTSTSFYEWLFNFTGQTSVMKSYPGNYCCKFKDKTPYEKAKLIALYNNSSKTNFSQKVVH